MIINLKINFIASVMLLGVSCVWAQEPVKKAEEMEAMPGTDQNNKSGAAHDMAQDTSNMNQDGAMDSGSMSMQGGSAPPDARDPHAYSGGYDFGPIPPPRMGDTHLVHGLMVDRFERVRTHDNSSTAYEWRGWLGRDYERAVLKAEGSMDDGELQETRTELLWGHAVTTYWDTQLGMRYDGGMEPSRRWLAFGIQGLAPYWFEVDATVYIGEEGRSALRVNAEYELLLTQKLIVQPKIEASFYGKSDAARGQGSGLSDLTAGMRLRYEIRRELAPYVGIEWARQFSGTADFARAAGNDTNETRLVAGLRFWF